MVGGATPSTWNFGSSGPRWSEIASAVTLMEKSSINTNRKFTTHFDDHRMLPLSPQMGAQRRKTAIFGVKSHFAWRKSARCSLHWLPTRQQVRYKLAVVSFKACHTGAPNYLSVLLQDYCPTRRLRSSSSLLLSVPRVSLQMTTRGFAHAAPSTWNSLDLSVRSISTLPAFKRQLKTYLMSADHSST